MGGAGENSFRKRFLPTAAALLALGLGVLAGAACPAEEPVDGKRLLLLYGTRRVEYVPDTQPPIKPDHRGAGDRLLLIGGADLARRADEEPAAQPDSPEGAVPVTPLPPVEPTGGRLAEEVKRLEAPLPGEGAFHFARPLPPAIDENPLRDRPNQPPCEPRGFGAQPPSVEFQNQSVSSADLAGWRHPPEEPVAEPPIAAREGHLQDASAALAGRASNPAGQAAPNSPQRDWLVAGAAQAAGTLVGLLLGGLIGLVVFLFIRDRAEVKFEPTIRLELPPLAGMAASGQPDAAGEYGPGDRCLRVVDTPPAARTPVADFRDDVIPFDLSAMANRQRADEAAQNRERQEKLLRQVYEDNLALRKAVAERKTNVE